MSDADVTRGIDVSNVRIVEYSLVPWPTHEDGSPYTDAEAAACGIHRVTVGEHAYGASASLMPAVPDHDAWEREMHGDWPAPTEEST